jgi:hypothetical protein
VPHKGLGCSRRPSQGQVHRVNHCFHLPRISGQLLQLPDFYYNADGICCFHDQLYLSSDCWCWILGLWFLWKRLFRFDWRRLRDSRLRHLANSRLQLGSPSHNSHRYQACCFPSGWLSPALCSGLNSSYLSQYYYCDISGSPVLLL